MKLFRTLLLICLSALFITSCQKELNFDLSALSTGTLKADSTTFECLPSTVQGIYQADSILGSGNYIDVQVDVTSVGIYQIASDTTNGFSFYGTGTFGNTGLNTVRLYGTGNPLLSGTTTFIISYGSSFCTVDVDVISANTSTVAVYTLGGAGSTCTGTSLTGTYMQGLPLTSSNTASVNVTVTSPGTYTLSTTTINGVSFSASGLLSVSNTGVTLTGTGTPTTSGTFNYPVSGGGSTCTFSVTFDPLASPAAYSLGGSPNGCTGASLTGTYDAGIAINSANTAVVNVNVSAIGSYSLTTTSVNGISFSASGLFTTIGNQPVTLYATGTPVSSGSYNYPVTGGGSTCTISVPVTGAPVNYITCKMDGVFTTFNINASAGLSNASGPSILSIDGSTNSAAINPSISLQVQNDAGGSVTAATYNVNQIASGITIGCVYFDAMSMQYLCASDGANQSQTPGFTITVSSISSTRCIGTFEGTIKDNIGAGPGFITVTEGTFNVPVQ